MFYPARGREFNPQLLNALDGHAVEVCEFEIVQALPNLFRHDPLKEIAAILCGGRNPNVSAAEVRDESPERTVAQQAQQRVIVGRPNRHVEVTAAEPSRDLAGGRVADDRAQVVKVGIQHGGHGSTQADGSVNRPFILRAACSNGHNVVTSCNTHETPTFARTSGTLSH